MKFNYLLYSVFFLFSSQLIAQQYFSDNVGIGVSSPDDKLDIRGTLRLRNSTNDDKSFQFSTYSDGTFGIRQLNQSSALKIYSSGSINNHLLTLRGGKVGIGEDNPGSKLEIKHSGNIGGTFQPDKSYLKITNGSNSLIMDPSEIYGNQSLIFGTSYSSDFVFRNVDPEVSETQMIIRSSGNVGIGTPDSDPVSAKLKIKRNSTLAGRFNSSTSTLTLENFIDDPNGGMMHLHMDANEIYSSHMLNVGSSATSGNIFTVRQVSSDNDKINHLVVNHDGKIGIGTEVDESKARLQILNRKTMKGFWRPEESSVSIENDNGVKMYMDANEIYSSHRLDVGSSATSGQIFTIRKVAADANTSHLIVNHDGKIGIGTEVDESKARLQILNRKTMKGFWQPEESSVSIENASGVEMYIDANEIYSNRTMNIGAIDQGAGNNLLTIRKVSSSGWSNKMIVDNEGNVGIGTEKTGEHRLAVHGSIGARSIKVELTNWSDFVFKDDYKLRPLSEVESFINENDHLPEIPSEQEVLENGVSLGEMDAKLLQKIEELTLYMIEVNKKIDGQAEEINQLKSENALLKRDLSSTEH